MLCECIPIGTRCGGIPTAIGDTGFYVLYGDVEATVEAIKRALNCNSEKGKAARKRIKSCFPISSRAKKLIEEIADLFQEKLKI